MITSDYSVVLDGVLGPTLRAVFDPFEVCTRPDTTVLVLRGVDQAGLHAVLARTRDLGLTLLEVRNRTPPG